MSDEAAPVTRSAPPKALVVTAFASTLFALLPLAFGVHYGRGWWDVRRGKDVVAQRETLTGVTWFQPAFHDFLDRFERTVPPDANVLVEPGRVRTARSTARWHLFLNHYAYPVRFYTRAPAWASGTLVDYPRWLEHHARTRTLSERLDDERAMHERGIEWILRVPIADRFLVDEVELMQRTEDGWIRVALAPSRRERRAPAAAGPITVGEGEHGIDEGGL
jgi:hypothetical protein